METESNLQNSIFKINPIMSSEKIEKQCLGLKLPETSSGSLQYKYETNYIPPYNKNETPVASTSTYQKEDLTKNAICLNFRNQANQQHKTLLISSQKLAQVKSNKILKNNNILKFKIKSPGRIINSIPIDISSLNGNKIIISKQMATRTKTVSSTSDKNSFVKTNEQLNTNINMNIDSSKGLGLPQIEKNYLEWSNNNFMGFSSNTKPDITENNCLRFPAQINSNITISKAANMQNRREEPSPSVTLEKKNVFNQQPILLSQNPMPILPIQLKSNSMNKITSLQKVIGNTINTKTNESCNFSSETMLEIENSKFINAIPSIGRRNKTLGGDKNENEKLLHSTNKLLNLNPITGYLETVQNVNINKNQREKTSINCTATKGIEQELNAAKVIDAVKLETNQCPKIIKHESTLNTSIQENGLNKHLVIVPDTTENIVDKVNNDNSLSLINSVNFTEKNIKTDRPDHLIEEKVKDFAVGKIQTQIIKSISSGSRTKVRAQSLNLQKRKQSGKRRSLPNVIKYKDTHSLFENVTGKSSRNSFKLSKLLCNEKIQISPDILKPQPKSGNQEIEIYFDPNEITPKKIFNGSLETKQHIVTLTPNVRACEIIELTSSESESPVSTDEVEYVSDIEIKPSEVIKPLSHHTKSFLKTVGLQINKNDALKNSRFSLNINELNLVELNEKQNINRELFGSSNYEKSIYCRESKSRNSTDQGHKLYFCKSCHCHGSPKDFLAMNFCSKECVDKMEKKKLQNHYDYYKGDKRQRKPPNLLSSKISNIVEDQKLQGNNISMLPKQKPVFTWQNYLNMTKAEPAGINLFLNPFPCGPNLFEVGMKLEAIDPHHNSLFCVCTIIEKKGFRLKLSFDSYSSIYDFWINADSMDIFPPGWCAKTQRTLMPPQENEAGNFSWPYYLMNKKAIAAPRHIFTHLNSCSNTNPFKVGMKFEADDLLNGRKVRVASVADVLDNRILVHFDGWDETWDNWVDCASPYIHPVHWHSYNNYDIVPPPNWTGIFSWEKYLEDTNSIPATEERIHSREPMGFKTGMKLEVVDKKNPSLIRPATVIMTDKFEIKVLYDGWSTEYAFWVVDDNPDIHPINWCESTGHELESPPGYESLPMFMPCPMPGCRGVGNAKNVFVDYHANLEECPYELSNWSMEIKKPDRMQKAKADLIDFVDPKNIKRKSTELIEHGGKSLQLIQCSTPNINSKEQISFTSLSLAELESIPSPYMDASITDRPTESNINSILSRRIELSKKLLNDYGPRLEYVHNYWLKNITKVFINDASQNQINLLTKNPLQWSTNDVFYFIKDIPQCNINIAEIFKYNDIDGEALLALNQNDLKDYLNLKSGPSIKIFNLIVYLRGEVLERYSK